jgi:hypothetical protein
MRTSQLTNTHALVVDTRAFAVALVVRMPATMAITIKPMKIHDKWSVTAHPPTPTPLPYTTERRVR